LVEPALSEKTRRLRRVFSFWLSFFTWCMRTY
jgi:hypothetical protein